MSKTRDAGTNTPLPHSLLVLPSFWPHLFLSEMKPFSPLRGPGDKVAGQPQRREHAHCHLSF